MRLLLCVPSLCTHSFFAVTVCCTSPKASPKWLLSSEEVIFGTCMAQMQQLLGFSKAPVIKHTTYSSLHLRKAGKSQFTPGACYNRGSLHPSGNKQPDDRRDLHLLCLCVRHQSHWKGKSNLSIMDPGRKLQGRSRRHTQVLKAGFFSEALVVLARQFVPPVSTYVISRLKRSSDVQCVMNSTSLSAMIPELCL